MNQRAEKLNRPGVPALDDILGVPFKVLDDGLIRVIDYMGDDQAIVQAARVSYGDGTKKTSDDRGLIRYLLRHRHTTPFEMCSLKLHIRVPMDAWRQWIRHRTACLAEGTELYFDASHTKDYSNTQLNKLKIEDIWQVFHSLDKRAVSNQQVTPDFNKNDLKNLMLRQLDEETNTISNTKIVDVFKNGKKKVFRFTLADGKHIEATSDHKFFFEDGWGTFKNKIGLTRTNGQAALAANPVFLHVNGTQCLVPAQEQNGQWTKEQNITIAHLVEVTSIEYLGLIETYDVEVEGPHHNFIANGIVTHNSVNETSTRYSIAIDSSQTTNADQWRIQATDNKQGSDGFLDSIGGAELTQAESDFKNNARQVYNQRLEKGVAREQARKDLPLCTYTEAYWKMDLHNLLHFLALRMDPHAQKEIRDYATVIGEEIVSRWVPLAWEAFQDYRMGSVSYSRIEHQIMAAVGAGNPKEAIRIATEAGWLKPSKKGGFIRNRERDELAIKLQDLNLTVPWK